MRDLTGLALPGLLALKWPVFGGLFLLLTSLLTVAFLPKLTFDKDIHRAFSSRGVHAENFKGFLDEADSATTEIVVVAQAKTQFRTEDYAAIRDLTLELTLVEGVEAVFSVASTTFPKKHTAFPEHMVLPSDLAGVDVAARIAEYERTLPHARSFVSSDRRTALLIVVVDTAVGPDGFEAAYAAVRRVTTETGISGLSFRFTGEEVVGPTVVDALARDLVMFNMAGAILAFLTARVIFGNLRLVVLACVPALLAALSSLGLFLVLGYPVTVLNNVVPVLVLVLGLADSVYLVLHFRDETGDGNLRKRAGITLQAIGPACALTAITTSIAFLAIATTDNPTLRELALTGALAVLAAYVVVVVSFAVLAPALGAGVAARRRMRWLTVPQSAAQSILGHGRLVTIASAIIFGLSAAGISQLQPWFDLDNNLPTTSEVRTANEIVSREFGGFFRLWAELDHAASDDQTHAWDRLRRLTEAMREVAPDYTVLSPVTFAEWLGTSAEPPSESDMRLLPAAFRDHFGSPEDGVARVLALVPQPMADDGTLAVHDRLEAAARDVGAARLVGLPMVMRHEPTIIVAELSVGLGLACLLATGLIALAFRAPHLAPVLLLPNMLPLTVSAAALHFINGGRLTPTALLALTVAFGIAVDDSIHLVNRFMVERRKGLGKAEAAAACVCLTSEAMIATTLLISIGLSVTMFSAFDTVKLFGTMLILTFAVALAADLLLLPALLRGSTRPIRICPIA